MASPVAVQSETLEGMSNLNIIRQLGLLLGLAASVAIGFAVVLWAQGGDYRPLYANLERTDSADILRILDLNQIKYKIDHSSGALLVDAEKYHEARIQLAADGIANEHVAGFELLDKEQPLGTSQFMETARYRRSLEGELARTIASIGSVRAARVHLAMPKRSVFVRDTRRPTASVLVDLHPGRGLSREQVNAIANLVASSVPEMLADDVTVVDKDGNLLSLMAKEDPDFAIANRHLDYTKKMEERLEARINAILEPVLGEGHFRAQVAADVDFTAVEQTDEVFNPDLPAVRSEQSLDEQRGAGEGTGGVPGALANQPPGDTEVADSGAQVDGSRSRKQVVRNYELDRTISHTRHQIGRVRRLSVAVVIDDLVRTDEGGQQTTAPWEENELERLTILVRDAVGYDPLRGDSVNVINSPFQVVKAEEELVPEELPLWEQPWVPVALQGIKYLAMVLAVLIIGFGVLRPVMKSLTQNAREAREFDAQRSLGDLGGGELGGGEGGTMMLPGPEAGHEQQLNQIKGMIAEDPGRVAQVVKTWVASEQ